MSYEFWVSFWKIVLYTGIGMFAALSVWVIFAGVGDIRRMFEELGAERDKPD